MNPTEINDIYIPDSRQTVQTFTKWNFCGG